MTSARRAQVVGLGLIGGSIGMALRSRGWHVAGRDPDTARAERAVALGAVDALITDDDAEITFVAVPVGAIPDAAREVLGGRGVVTDVGSVKAPVVRAVDDPRFVGGHPMAGSEQEGIEGADGGLFEGATWVLTPTETTDEGAFVAVRSIVASFGANVVAVPPDRHDALVAVVSHVPHLTAATLMALAADAGEEHATLLRLAAGGFRDMTRVAAGHPGIWPDICTDNRDAIVATLDLLLAALTDMRGIVDARDRHGLLTVLERARAARINLPAAVAARAEELLEMRVPVLDRPGALAEVTTLASELDVNIHDLEIAHSAEGNRGVVVLVIDASSAELLRGGLLARGYRPAIGPLA
jgi:prephenate dehydrogenase